MSEPLATPTGDTAGAMLRRARTAQGMHIAALAATIKVPQRKLESLEADRYDELPDAAFARALAKTVCRVLKIDAEPVLAKLPQPRALRLDAASHGTGQPFNTPSAIPAPESDLLGVLGHPAAWGPALILLGALALWMLPEGMFQRRPAQVVQDSAANSPAVTPTPVAAAPDAATAAASPASVAAPAVPATALPSADMAPATGVAAMATAASGVAPTAGETVHASPDSAAAASGTGDVRIRTTAPSWIGVVDAQGQTLLHRTVQPGEAVDLSGATPLKVRVGNVAATQLSFRGQPVDLNPSTKGNIARLELQ